MKTSMTYKQLYRHFGSVTISLAEMDEYDRLTRRQIVRGRAIRRRRIEQLNAK